MNIPSYSKLMWPLMTLLYRHKESLHVSEVCKLLADDLKLSEEDRAKMLPSGRQPLLKNRIGWAQDATFGKIVGMDGERLTELMMDYDVGVSNTLLKVPKIDKDYFEE